MRLIDADALGMYLNYWRYGDFSDIKHEREYAVLSDVIEAVHHAPTVEAVERKRGRWIHDGYDIPHGVDWMHCSVCGRREPHVPAAMTNFCPSCGTDMRGEANERTEVCNLQE